MISNRICVNNKKDVTVLNIYVSNLPYRLSNEELRDIFAAYGEVSRVKIVKDKETNRSKGFGFVEMSNDDEGKRAIAELNDKDVGGRALRVNEARPRE
ncbi:RNA recognition motif domain-containing protein [Campylobacter vicugnae]|uniref:RNA recognition motif domain-containing protein n=1 Tax=Campylobacter vicugnae TaxID=1660076 RepID=UPI000A354F63|nr:RNA-binding protein [Campylobacter sp. RM8970]